MAETKKIKIHPVSLNETTLETNIVSEIATLFRNPSGFSYSTRLRWFFDFPISKNSKKVKIYRLTPAEEYHGGGWDSKLVIPNGNKTNRAVFIQFKSGKHSEGNTILNSIFNTNHRNPNRHVEFTFNDNSDNTQHQTLKNLHDELVSQGLPSKSVMYGFPRITDLDTFDKLEEDLLLHTTFLSISEMDTKAATNNANLYDSNIHHFRTCYYDETRREISSNPFSIGKPKDPSGLLYEILLVRFAHWRSQLSERIPLDLINEEFYFILADFLRINPFKLYDFRYLRSFPYPNEKDLKVYYAKVENNSINNLFEYFGGNNNELGNIEWRKDLFNRIIKFVNERKERIIDVESDIPSEFSFSLSEEKPIEIRFKEKATYNLIVF